MKSGKVSYMTWAEIAAVLGESPKTVASTCYRAIDKLKKQTPNALLLMLVYAKELERVRGEGRRRHA